MWTAKSPGHVRSGGCGVTCSLWVCYEVSHVYSLEHVQTLFTGVGFYRRGSLLMLQDSVEGLKIKSLPSLPVLRERIY